MIKIFLKIILLTAGFIFISACANKPCNEHQITSQTNAQKQESLQAMNDQVKNQDLTNRVRVYKPDGSLQCGMGKKIDLDTMKKDLGDIKVYSSENKHDGLMRVQVCGHPTGNCNIYEINSSDLEKASQAGFKKWIRD